jgi:ribonuclease HI
VTYIAYFDGACEPVNPGGTASYGAVIIEDDETIWECSEVYGQGKLMSNNVAEYAGFIAVLEWFIEQELCDAEIVVKRRQHARDQPDVRDVEDQERSLCAAGKEGE